MLLFIVASSSAASAAPERGLLFASINTGDGTPVGWPSKDPKLQAEWRQTEQGNFKATVTAVQSVPGKATWTVELDDLSSGSFKPLTNADGKECETLNWHIHQDFISGGDSPAACGSTGGHVDPALACGGASEYAKTSCIGMNAGYQLAESPYSARCGTSMVKTDLPNQDGCEYGDLAGKVGQIKNEKGTQTFEDTHIFFLDRYAKNSIVFHCCIDGNCSPRVACADFSYIGQ